MLSLIAGARSTFSKTQYLYTVVVAREFEKLLDHCQYVFDAFSNFFKHLFRLCCGFFLPQKGALLQL